MTILNAEDLTLLEVHQLLPIDRRFEGLAFTSLLHLEPLTEFQQREVAQISRDFQNYLSLGKVSEGQVKLLSQGCFIVRIEKVHWSCCDLASLR